MEQGTASEEQINALRVRVRALRIFMAKLSDKRLQDAEILLSVVEGEIERNCKVSRKSFR
jgi:hypothetical protein